MQIIAHRGSSYDAPENTLAAVRLAWRQHADAVEVDVHLSRDGRLVVIHDDHTRRTAGARGKVARQTLHQLRARDAGSWKGPAWQGEKIPTLDEVLATVPHGRRLFIEIKTRANTVPALTKALLHCSCRPEQLVLISFSFRAVQALKRAFPHIEVCWLSALRPRTFTRRPPNIPKLIQKIRHAGLDGLDLQANRALTADRIKKLRFAGLKLYVWTVDSPATAHKLAQAGVNGLTTNRPALLRKLD